MKNYHSYWIWILSLLVILFSVSACKTSKKVEATSSSTKKQPHSFPSTPPHPAITDNPNSLLWEISGNGLEQPSYLFGTIHLISKKDFFMSDLVKDRFARTEQLVLEIDMDDPTVLLKTMSGMMMEGNVSIKDLVDETDYNRLVSYFEDTLGMGGFMLFERMKPILLSTLMMEKGGEEEMMSYEAVFMEMAISAKKETKGLETADYQLAMLDSIPYKVQAQMLVDAMDETGADDGMFERMITLYKQQEVEALYKITMEESSELGDYEGPLLKNRNRNWIPVIAEMSAEMPSFFAVGAAHLGGEVGVLNLLREEGYALTPLRDTE